MSVQSRTVPYLTDNSLFINIEALIDKENVCHEENISAEQQKKEENSRIQGPHENRRRPEGPQESQGEGQEKTVCLMDERLPPRERVRKTREFLTLYKTGDRYRGRYFHVVFRANSVAFSRMAAVVSGKVGNAVVRNKIKRRLRALFRRNKTLFRKPMDIVFIARKEIVDLSGPDLAAEFFTAVNRISRDRSA
jgi:ribonuclease P protein component